MTTLTLRQQRVLKVLERISDMVRKDDDDAGFWATELQVITDTMHGNDFFGTEGQCDPRGDFRNGYWHLEDGPIEGVDK